MLKHQKIRETMNEVRALYAAGVISTPEFIRDMNKLKDQLEAEEKKLYAVDRRGGLDLLRFITGTVPDAFMRIHTRFPHLTMNEVIAFEQTMCASGGSVTTHSGVFAPTDRWLNWDSSPEVGRSTYKKCSVSWTCCHTINSWGRNGPNWTASRVNRIENGVWQPHVTNEKFTWHKAPDYRNGESGTPPLPSPDLTNPNPIGRCDTPVNFSLRDFVEKAEVVDTSETLKDIKVATQAQINATEAEIARLRKKVGVLDDMLAALDRLTDV